MALFNIYGKPVVSGSGVADGFFDIESATGRNIYNPVGYTEGYKLGDSGAYLLPLAGCTTTDFFDIHEYVGKYLYSEIGEVSAWNFEKTVSTYPYYGYLRFYDADQKPIDKNYYNGTSYKTANCAPVLIPSDAHYVRITVGHSVDIHKLMIAIADDNSDAFIPWESYEDSMDGVKGGFLKQENFRLTDLPETYGKTWVLFGDSLTDVFGGKDWNISAWEYGEYGTVGNEENTPWTDYFFASKTARQLGLRIDNRAKAGSNINTATNGNYTTVNGVAKLNEFLAEIEAGTTEQPGYITVAFGTNAYTSQNGTVEDTSENTATTSGATRYFIEKIREKCPKSVFGFILPPVGTWGENASKDIDAGRAAIKAVCDAEGVPYIDMSKESGITVDMLPDGIHVSSHQANNLYYHALRRFMMGL